MAADKIWEEFAEKRASPLRSYISKKFNSNTERVLSDGLKLNKKLVVLDAGCGSGRWSFFFAPRVKKVFGIDSSKTAIQNARSANKFSNTQFKIGTLTKLPFKNNTFDLTYTCITLQHIVNENDFQKAVSELIRVTKKPGRIAIFETIRQTKQTRSNYIVCRSVKEYKRAFENFGARFLCGRGIRFPYLYFAYLTLLKKIYGFSPKYRDVRDTIAFFKK
ncbi:TPA: class I SAM-dependent methyltransferase, partial [archaeon]|nr:class I SAM-dependent methyltransferase [Candidatus Naiadarchaeales archaeon SRR2090153.bin1042]